MCCCCCCFRWLRSAKSWCGCAVLSLIGSLCFFALAFWAFKLHASLSPVFTDVECRLKSPKIEKVSFAGGFHINFITSTVCLNPNPYKVNMRSGNGVNVYMGKKFIKVASVQHIPETVLPAKGEGSIDIHVQMKPTRKSWGAMMGVPFSSSTPIYVENNIDLTIDLNFFITRFKVGLSFTKDCGFNLQVFRSAFAKVGPLACADSFDSLEIPPVGEEGFTGELDLYAGNLAGDEIKAGTLAKDVGLGVAMISGCFWGSVLLVGSVFGCCRCRQYCSGARGPEADRKKEMEMARKAAERRKAKAKALGQTSPRAGRKTRPQTVGAESPRGMGLGSVVVDVEGGANAASAAAPEAAVKRES